MKNNCINESSLPITDIFLVSSILKSYLCQEKKDALAVSLKDPTEGPF